MKKLLLATCLLSSSAFAFEKPMSVEFTAGYIPTQDLQFKAGGGSSTLSNDGYFFRAALTDNKFRAFGSMQEVSGTTCIGNTCLNHEVLETRGGIALTTLDNGQLKLSPRLEYVTLETTALGSSSTNNGLALGVDATLTVSASVDVFGGFSYLKLKDSNGPEFMLGATLKTDLVNFVLEGRHVKLDDSENNVEITSNEIKLGIQKALSF